MDPFKFNEVDGFSMAVARQILNRVDTVLVANLYPPKEGWMGAARDLIIALRLTKKAASPMAPMGRSKASRLESTRILHQQPTRATLKQNMAKHAAGACRPAKRIT